MIARHPSSVLLLVVFVSYICLHRVMYRMKEMPTIAGKTIGMTRGNCMTYCYDESENGLDSYKFFGETIRNTFVKQL